MHDVRTSVLPARTVLGLTLFAVAVIAYLRFTALAQTDSTSTALLVALAAAGPLVLAIRATRSAADGALPAAVRLRPLGAALRPVLSATPPLLIALALTRLASMSLLGVPGADAASSAPGWTAHPGTWHLAAALAWTVALAPFYEEILFRGFLLRLLEERWGAGWAVLGSALVFAALHRDPVSFPYLFGLGAALGCAVILTGSLWAAVVIHVVNNGFVTLIELAAADRVGSAEVPELGFAHLVVLVLATGAILRQVRRLRASAGALGAC